LLPSWATILTSIVAALFGGAVGGIIVRVMQSRHERAEAWRDRLVPAADDLATGILQAILAVRDAVGVAHGAESDQDLEVEPDKKVPSILDLPEVQEANAELERRVDEAHARLARVQLLFGVQSPAETAAADCVRALRKAQMHLRDWPKPEWRAADMTLEEITVHHEAFASAALDAIRRADLASRPTDS
jgi:hypothetical protein